MFENARAAEGKAATENSEKANAYSVLKMNNGIIIRWYFKNLSGPYNYDK